jgi:hypothetical protein
MSEVKPREAKVEPSKADAGTKPIVPTPPTAAEKAANEEVFDWASLAAAQTEPEDSKFSRGLKVDIEKEVHESIRNDVEKALLEPGVYRLKTCATPEQAKKFAELAKRYARYRPAGQITVRGGPTKLDPKVVRFNAKPLEKREPKVKAVEEGQAKTADK